MDAVEYEIQRPKSVARYAAELELFVPRQGQADWLKTPLEVEVSLGEQTFIDGTSEDRFGFTLRFRKVILDVTTYNCVISRTGRYERTLPQDEFKQFIKRVIESSRMAGAEGGMGVSSSLTKLLSAVGLDLSAHARVAGEIKKGNLTSIESSLPFKLVRWVGAGRWEIGHDQIGDPREIDGLLKGAYFSHPSDGRSAEDTNPVCFIEPSGTANYSVVVELRARLGDCVYFPVGDLPPEPLWVRRNKDTVEALLVQKMLRERNRADGHKPPEGEIILSRGRLVIRRDKAGG